MRRVLCRPRETSQLRLGYYHLGRSQLTCDLDLPLTVGDGRHFAISFSSRAYGGPADAAPDVEHPGAGRKTRRLSESDDLVELGLIISIRWRREVAMVNLFPPLIGGVSYRIERQMVGSIVPYFELHRSVSESSSGDVLCRPWP